MATFTQTISEASNACKWLTSGSGFGNNATYIGDDDPGTLNNSLRFTSITIPQNATITSATLSIVISFNYNTPAEGKIYGEDADNPSAPSNATDGISRTKTTAYTNQTYTGVGTFNTNVKTVIEEITTRAGWASGNALQFIIADNGSGQACQVRAGAVGTDARTLTIEYTPPSSAPQIMIF